MNIKTAVLVLSVCAGPGCSAALRDKAPTNDRPNIVYFLADDLGWADVGWHGDQIKTPHLDRLAAAGAKLEQFYVLPVCSPTRAAFMTGRYPMRLGLQVGVIYPWSRYGLPLQERMLSQALKEAGYRTAISGKWHLGLETPEYLPLRRGFDHQYGHYLGAIDYFTHERDGGFDWHRDEKVSRDEGYSTELIGKEAARLVREHAGKEPLFLYVPFNAVHTPHQVPEIYKAPYASLPEPRRTYAGMIAAMDEAVGVVVKATRDMGISDNTLFLFSSDNGGPNPGEVSDNGRLRAGKATLYEGGVRVPAFATWADHIKANTVVNEPLHVVDLYPTLIRLAGGSLDQPLPIDGRDAWATITAGAPSPHQEILLNTEPTGGAIRVGDWKLRVTNDTVELYDLSQDIGETRDRSAEEPERVRDLRARYDRLAAEASPPLQSPRPADYKAPAIWGEGTRP